MKKGIDNSKVVVVCMHPDYVKSKNCMFELSHALREEKVIVVLNTGPELWAKDSYLDKPL